MVATAAVASGQAPDVRRNVFNGAFAIGSATGGPEFVNGEYRPITPIGKESPWKSGGVGDKPEKSTSDILTAPVGFKGPSGDTAGSFEARAFATMGTLNGFARVEGTVSDSLALIARASAFTADELTWFAPGHTKLKVTVPIVLRGQSTASLQENPQRDLLPSSQFVRSSFRAVAQVNDSATNQFVTAAVSENFARPGATGLPGDFMLTMEVFAGRPVLYSLSVDVQAGMSLNNTPVTQPGRTSVFDASADYGHTVYWGGVQSVTDALTGEPISDWSMKSLSGADYTRSFEPVPEPSTIALAGGLAALVVLARQRRAAVAGRA